MISRSGNRMAINNGCRKTKINQRSARYSWSCFAERLACSFALFWYRVGGFPRWLCALPKGPYRPKLQQMGWQMNLQTFLQTFGPQLPVQSTSCLGKGGRVEPRSCIWPYIVGACTGLVHCLATSTNQNIYRERCTRPFAATLTASAAHTGRAYTEGSSVV
jgi:hypothetical protein